MKKYACCLSYIYHVSLVYNEKDIKTTRLPFRRTYTYTPDHLCHISDQMGHRVLKKYEVAGEPTPRLTIDGHTFRDLNKNGALDVYEDVRATQADRVGRYSGANDS